MDTEHTLSFRPADELESQEFEAAVHDFVAQEAGKPAEAASCVFVRFESQSSRWRLSFETAAALEAFRTMWAARARSLPAVAAR